MESIHKNTSRVGNITSSGIVALTTNGKAKDAFGKTFYTYIEECNIERRLGRSLDSESNAHPLTWGLLVEKRVFELLGLEYKMASSETISHDVFDCWAGSPDGVKFDEGGTVFDIKSPHTLKSFCTFVDCITMVEVSPGVWAMDGTESMNKVRENHPDGEKYYWQLVSNAILTKSKFAELIFYCPYQSELPTIKDMASNVDELNTHKYMWIFYAQDSELPYLPDGGYYKNLYTIRFEVPEQDKVFLTNRVISAKQLLLETPH